MFTSIKSKFRNRVVVAVLGVAGLGIGGCATNTGTGALVGGAAGGGLGALITHRPGGAVVGAAAGAVTGALVGNEIDRREDRGPVEYRRVATRFVGYDAWGRPVYERVVYRPYD